MIIRLQQNCPGLPAVLLESGNKLRLRQLQGDRLLQGIADLEDRLILESLVETTSVQRS